MEEQIKEVRRENEGLQVQVTDLRLKVIESEQEKTAKMSARQDSESQTESEVVTSSVEQQTEEVEAETAQSG